MRMRPGVVRAGLRACRPLFASSRISLGGKRRMYEVFTGVARPPRGTRFERGAVVQYTLAGMPVSATADIVTRCAWMWSGWP